MRICLRFLYYKIPGLSFLIASSGDANLVWFELKNKSLLGPIYSQMKSGTRFQALETSMGRSPRSFCCVKILESEDTFLSIFCRCHSNECRSRVAGIITYVAKIDRTEVINVDYQTQVAILLKVDL